MVASGCWPDWQLRLAGLKRLVADDPQGPIWLWQIRIRILTYLVSRYAETPSTALGRKRETAESQACTESVEMLPPVPPTTLLPPVGVEHPPKPAAVIAKVLVEIHELHQQRRIDQWINPAPDVVWQWWRSAWCLRR